MRFHFQTAGDAGRARVRAAAVRNALLSLLLLCALFVAENRKFLFDYLPFREGYETAEAEIVSVQTRWNYATVTVFLDGQVLGWAVVKHSCNEGVGDRFALGYSPWYEPNAVRVQPVVTWGQVGVFLALLLGNGVLLRRARRAAQWTPGDVWEPGR